MSVQTTLFGTVLQQKTIYDHPTTQYEQFIERYGRHKGSGKSKAMVISDVNLRDHPTTQYEQFIERHYGRHKGSGKSKAMVISDVNLRSSNNSV